MDTLGFLTELDRMKHDIDTAIERIREAGDTARQDLKGTDQRRLIILVLSAIGALVLIGAIAYLVYRYFSRDVDEADDEAADEEGEVTVDEYDIDGDGEPDVVVAHIGEED